MNQSIMGRMLQHVPQTWLALYREDCELNYSHVPTPPTRVSFGPGTLEAMPYEDLPQAPYPPPAVSEADDLASTARTTAKKIRQVASLEDFIASKQQSTLEALPAAVTHPAATLLQSYVDEGIPVNTGPPWSRNSLDEAIHNGPHASVCALDIVSFIQGEL